MELDINKLLDGIAVSSRVRLARNLSGLVFPTVYGEKQKEIAGRVEAVLRSVGEFKRMDVRDLSGTELLALKEKYLISADLIEKKAQFRTGRRLVVNDNCVKHVVLQKKSLIAFILFYSTADAPSCPIMRKSRVNSR